MMRTVKLTSPMSVGSWILTAFGAFAGLAVASEVGRHVVDDDSTLGRVRRVADPVAAVGSALFAPPLAAYTAVLLADTATPSWHESYRELPFVFVGSANAAAAGLALVTAPTSQAGPARKLAVAGAALELVALEQMERTMGELVAEPLHEGRAGGAAQGEQGPDPAVAPWAPPCSAATARPLPSAALALMAGSACTRFGIFEAGLESAKDPRYTVTPQRERLERRREQGVTHDSITTSRQ